MYRESLSDIKRQLETKKRALDALINWTGRIEEEKRLLRARLKDNESRLYNAETSNERLSSYNKGLHERVRHLVSTIDEMSARRARQANEAEQVLLGTEELLAQEQEKTRALWNDINRLENECASLRMTGREVATTLGQSMCKLSESVGDLN